MFIKALACSRKSDLNCIYTLLINADNNVTHLMLIFLALRYMQAQVPHFADSVWCLNQRDVKYLDKNLVTNVDSIHFHVPGIFKPVVISIPLVKVLKLQCKGYFSISG